MATRTRTQRKIATMRLTVCIFISGIAAAAVPINDDGAAQIHALESGLSAAINARDAKKVMSYYALRELFVFDASPPRQYVGWVNYSHYWDQLLGTAPGNLHIGITDLDVTIVGDFAYGHNIEHASWETSNGVKTELVIRVSHVYRKIKNQWFIVQEHTSVPVDFDTMKPDIASSP